MYGLYTKIFIEIRRRSALEIGHRVNVDDKRSSSSGVRHSTTATAARRTVSDTRNHNDLNGFMSPTTTTTRIEMNVLSTCNACGPYCVTSSMATRRNPHCDFPIASSNISRTNQSRPKDSNVSTCCKSELRAQYEEVRSSNNDKARSDASLVKVPERNPADSCEIKSLRGLCTTAVNSDVNIRECVVFENHREQNNPAGRYCSGCGGRTDKKNDESPTGSALDPTRMSRMSGGRRAAMSYNKDEFAVDLKTRRIFTKTDGRTQILCELNDNRPDRRRWSAWWWSNQPSTDDDHCFPASLDRTFRFDDVTRKNEASINRSSCDVTKARSYASHASVAKCKSHNSALRKQDGSTARGVDHKPNDCGSRLHCSGSSVRCRPKKENTSVSRSLMISPGTSLSKEVKAARQLGVIMAAFTLCFCPYFVCFMVVAFCESCIDARLMAVVTWVGYLNSALNPVLYPLCNRKFRMKFQKMCTFSSASFRTANESVAMSRRHCPCGWIRRIRTHLCAK